MGIGKAIVGRVDAVVPEAVADPELALGLLGGIQIANGRALAAECEISAVQYAAGRCAVGFEGHLGNAFADSACGNVDGADLAAPDAIRRIRRGVIGQPLQRGIVFHRDLAQLLNASARGIVAGQLHTGALLHIVQFRQQRAVLIGGNGIGP